jgi:tRNA(Ile)-lysidine synthase
MASSRRSARADGGADRVAAAVGAWADALPSDAATVAIALSGGRDSMALLDAAVPALAVRGRAAIALHVHHGLAADADRWVEACAAAARSRGIEFDARRVDVARLPRTSLEAQARDARYEALRQLASGHGAHDIALAHHADDQAETLLLQLMRGAGLAGLASMSAQRTDAGGTRWWRPLLALDRDAIDAYARSRSIAWVDDPSNAERLHRRNAIRHDVMPAIRAIVPAYATTFARSARHCADAVELLDALAAQDARAATWHPGDGSLDAGALATLARPRARNLLRWVLRERGLPSPSEARLAEMLRQLAHARVDARIEVKHAGTVVARHRGRVHIRAARPADYAVAWRGEPAVALAHGTLVFERSAGDGIDPDRVAAGLCIRPRRAGDRVAFDAGGAPRTLASVMQRSGMPAWERDALPLVALGGVVIAAPGLGVDAAWRAPAGRPGFVPRWRPLASADERT